MSAKKRQTSQKREREFKKRERQRKKAQQAAEKRERRFERGHDDASTLHEAPSDPTSPDTQQDD